MKDWMNRSGMTVVHFAEGDAGSEGEAGGGGEDHFAGKDAGVVSFADNKGWKSGAEAVVGYQELEKKIGTMSGVPNDKSSDEDWDNFTAKTRPRNVAEYKDVPPEGLPEGIFDESMAGVMKQAAHDAGIPTRQFTQQWDKYWETIGAQTKALDEKAAEIRTADEKTVRASWGVDYETNTKMANSAFEKTGVAEFLIGNGMNTHPGMLVLGHHAAIQLEEMAAAGGGGKDGEGKDIPWHRDYQEVRDN